MFVPGKPFQPSLVGKADAYLSETPFRSKNHLTNMTHGCLGSDLVVGYGNVFDLIFAWVQFVIPFYLQWSLAIDI